MSFKSCNLNESSSQRKRKAVSKEEKNIKKIKTKISVDESLLSSIEDKKSKVDRVTKQSKGSEITKPVGRKKEKTSNESGSVCCTPSDSSNTKPLVKPCTETFSKQVELLSDFENISLETSQNLINLLDDGCTIPFIARYRSHLTGSLKPEKLRKIQSSYEYINKVQKKSSQVLGLILQKNPSPPSDLVLLIESARTLEDLEFIEAPFKSESKKTLAGRAKAKGLEQPTLRILKGEPVDLHKYVNSAEGLETFDEVKLGVQHIIAEVISKDPQVLKLLDEIKSSPGVTLESKLKKGVQKNSDENKYKIYDEFSHVVRNIKPHQVLAINRGEEEKFLSVKINIPEKLWIPIRNYCSEKLGNLNGKDKTRTQILTDSVEDAIKRLLSPFVVRRIRAKLKEDAEAEALIVFERNLKQLLLTPPFPGQKVLAIDPGLRNGCKLAVVSGNGCFLESGMLYLDNKEAAAKTLKKLLIGHQCSVIALGNGTGSRETECLLTFFIKKGIFSPLNVSYTIVSEQGISVYSCSPVAEEEFPNLKPNIISAISLARRLQNPLSELVKVEPKHLGVGMYQHDVNQKKLEGILEEVVMECVSFVGVDINTASVHLLKRVAGLNETKAKEIVKYRNETCYFKNRQDLTKVKGIKDKTFLQCAGFIRIKPSTARCESHSHDQNFNPLDETAIHPESYDLVFKLIQDVGLNIKDLGNPNFINLMKNKVKFLDIDRMSNTYNCSPVTLEFILETLSQPKDFDIRTLSPKPIFKREVKSLKDLKQGVILTGVVNNVVTFGAFVDVGFENNGLIHISKMNNKSISVGSKVEVKVLAVEGNKIKLELVSVL